jgi:hypothetical protein
MADRMQARAAETLVKIDRRDRGRRTRRALTCWDRLTRWYSQSAELGDQLSLGHRIASGEVAGAREL